MKTEETKRREKKAIDDIFKKGKDSVMMEEIVNEDFGKTSNGINAQMKQEAQLVIWKTVLIMADEQYYELRTSKVRYLKKITMNENFIDMVKNLRTSNR